MSIHGLFFFVFEKLADRFRRKRQYTGRGNDVRERGKEEKGGLRGAFGSTCTILAMSRGLKAMDWHKV